MLKRRLLTTIVVISVALISLVVGVYDIFYAIVLAIAAAIVIDYIRKKPDIFDKISRRTKRYQPRPLLARLILPNNTEIKIIKNEKIFRRDDCVGTVSSDDLEFISKEHFKIVRMDDGLYIEDLNSDSGTKLNGDEIKAKEKRKLKDGDEISVANVLKIKYVQEQAFQ